VKHGESACSRFSHQINWKAKGAFLRVNGDHSANRSAQGGGVREQCTAGHPCASSDRVPNLFSRLGRDGVIGGSIGTAGQDSFAQAVVQVDGSAWRIGSTEFLVAFNASARLQTLVNRYQSVLMAQAQQSAACHAVHTVEARLCRWLLQSQDATGSDTLSLTQEFLSHMLGVQRNSVSLCANTLQHAGFIKYSRGKIDILNRGGLEEATCECYQVIRERLDQVVR
jgi:hypothetical protein